jgi:GTP-binding protein
VAHRDNQSFVMADIPGIIEGAHEGRGLGLRFLRHIERNAILLFMIAADSKNIAEEYAILLNELKEFNLDLLDKQRILAITKADLLDDELMAEMESNLPDVKHLFISSITGFGIQTLKDMLWEELNDEANRVMTLSHHLPTNVILPKHEIEPDLEQSVDNDEAEYEWDE